MRSQLSSPPVRAAALLALALLPWLQDPPPAPAPAPVPTPVPPAPAPTETPTEPAPQAPASRAVRHPLEGVYELRARFLDGKKALLPSRGWLAITQRHLFLCVSAPGSDPELPLLRTGVRTWHPEVGEGSVRLTVQLGWFTDKDGKVHLERSGADERRRIEPIRGGVRIAQDERNFLEFERVE
jgi:hypothetical protein